MKPEELIYSLDYVGDDLLADTERTIQVRRKQPWLGAVAAAMLILAMGAGGYAFWMHLSRNLKPAETGAVTAIMPNPDPSETSSPPTDPEQLTPIPVGRNYTGISDRAFLDVDAALQSNPWQEDAYDFLPVYRNLAYAVGVSVPCWYNRTQLQEKLTQAVDRIGLRLTGEPEYHEWVPDGSLSPYPGAPTFEIMAETDAGTLTVRGDGSILLIYDAAHAIPADRDADAARGEEGLTEVQQEAARRQSVIRSWMEQLQPVLQMPDYGISAYAWQLAQYSTYESWTVYPLRDDPLEQLLSYHFESVRLLTEDGSTLRGLMISQLAPEGGYHREERCQPAPWRECVANYPVISAQQAKAYLANGMYFTEADLFAWWPVSSRPIQSADREYLSRTLPDDHMELVYLTETQHELLIPFYRFWIQSAQAEDYGEYLAVYVPAVEPCADFPEAQTGTDSPFSPENGVSADGKSEAEIETFRDIDR